MTQRCDNRHEVDVARQGEVGCVMQRGEGEDRDRLITIVFTEEQIAYLDDRIRVTNLVRATGRVGGSRYRGALPEDRAGR